MQMAAHPPQEILAAAEQPKFLLAEQAGTDQLLGVMHAIDVFGDPEQRIKIAQPALALFDVGLDEIARRAGALRCARRVPPIWRRRIPARSLRTISCSKRVSMSSSKCPVAEDEAASSSAVRTVMSALGLPQAFLDRARGVADLLLRDPKAGRAWLRRRLVAGRGLGRAAEKADRCRSRAPASPRP